MSRDTDDFLRDQDTWHKPRGGWRSWVRFALHWLAVLAMLGALVGIIYLMSACSTVTPKVVESSGASYDGGERNSGILGFMADGSVHISENARNRYNALVEIYGRDFSPPLRRDSGVTELPDHSFSIDQQHAVDFDVMRVKERSGIKPHP